MYKSIDPQKGSYSSPGLDTVSEGSLSGGMERIYPRELSTGSTRGTQTVGYGNTKIDGSKDRITVGDSIVLDGGIGAITVTNPDKSVIGMGPIPGFTGQFGFYSLDANGKLVMKIVLATMYVYDPTTAKNTVQVGTLPDSTGGIAAANQGYNVSEGF